MEMPVFALHSVLFPGQAMGLQVFEPRYLALVADIAHTARFVVVAIEQGQEVGGTYEPYRVGVTVSMHPDDADGDLDEGIRRLQISGHDRVALIEPLGSDPYPVWQIEPYPDEGGAGTDDVQAATEALAAYLRATGEGSGDVLSVPHDPVAASYVLAAATPGLVPQRQRLLEAAGAGERLVAVRAVLRRETALVRALGAGVGGAALDINPN
jgi:Lon protease-like protein